MRRAVIGMSGGVDSAMAARYLQEDGFFVIGIHLVMHDQDDPVPTTQLCNILNIPVRHLDVRSLFDRQVQQPFFADLEALRTPNPCVRCNAEVKFSALRKAAHQENAEVFATGHYARILPPEVSKAPWRLVRGIDHRKDQSYMLYRLPNEWLPSVRFPLGNRKKIDVQSDAATTFGSRILFPGESQDICFLPPGGLPKALTDRCQPLSGPIITVDGEILGRHKGLSRYTMGQRKGLGLSGGPWFVVGKDLQRHALFVGRKEDSGVNTVFCRDAVWHQPLGLQVFSAEAQWRYRAPSSLVRVTISTTERRFFVEAEEDLFGVAPGQSLVLYHGDTVLGGGVIDFTERSIDRHVHP